jgi:hypothetical protein
MRTCTSSAFTVLATVNLRAFICRLPAHHFLRCRERVNLRRGAGACSLGEMLHTCEGPRREGRLEMGATRRSRLDDSSRTRAWCCRSDKLAAMLAKRIVVPVLVAACIAACASAQRAGPELISVEQGRTSDGRRSQPARGLVVSVDACRPHVIRDRGAIGHHVGAIAHGRARRERIDLSHANDLHRRDRDLLRSMRRRQ